MELHLVIQGTDEARRLDEQGRTNQDDIMRLALKLHPQSTCLAVKHIEVEVTRRASELALRYCVTGIIEDLRLPPVMASVRRDELWQHTCFEAFAGVAQDGYSEFNFAPSTEWAAYGFSGYRIGMHDLVLAPPRIETHAGADRYELRALLELPGRRADATWQIGLSAVIEETSGQKSYWALAHPPGKADFHHPDCFVVELPGP